MSHEQHIANLPPVAWESVRSLGDKRRTALITSPTALARSQYLVSGLDVAETVLIESSQQQYAEKLAQTSSKADVCFLLGGGQVIDIGRYLANAWQKEAIGIPSIISTDAPFVDCTGLRKDGCVTYVKSKRADSIILDQELLDNAPWRYHLSGCGDVLSIFTALFDWEYANQNKKVTPGETYNQSVAVMARGILDGLLSQAEEIKRGSEVGLSAIVTALAMEVQLCNLYGNSRPEEGGEHFFTYCIENKMGHFLHGEMVSFAVLLTGFLQCQDIRDLKQFMDDIRLTYKPEGLNRRIVREVLQELPQYVAMHKLGYSIYNNFNYIKEQTNIEHFFELIQL